jgi:hypothetical protein
MTMHHRVFAILFALSFLKFGSPAWAQADGDWPCIQPRVATLGVGQMWSGPALDSAGDWRSDPELAQLIPVLAARRLSVEEAGVMIDTFAEAVGQDKNQRLTLLFAGLFDEMNASRTRIMAGIERYARRQRELAQRINDTRAEMASRGLDGGMPGQAGPSDLEQSLAWDTRIYDERAQSITYVCETPVRIEQRLFALARIIQNDMD